MKKLLSSLLVLFLSLTMFGCSSNSSTTSSESKEETTTQTQETDNSSEETEEKDLESLETFIDMIYNGSGEMGFQSLCSSGNLDYSYDDIAKAEAEWEKGLESGCDVDGLSGLYSNIYNKYIEKLSDDEQAVAFLNNMNDVIASLQ